VRLSMAPLAMPMAVVSAFTKIPRTPVAWGI
jgi:hypothetical protein